MELLKVVLANITKVKIRYSGKKKVFLTIGLILGTSAENTRWLFINLLAGKVCFCVFVFSENESARHGLILAIQMQIVNGLEEPF